LASKIQTFYKVYDTFLD